MTEHLDAMTLEVAAAIERAEAANVAHMNMNEGHKLVELGDVVFHLQELQSHLKAMRREMR